MLKHALRAYAYLLLLAPTDIYTNFALLDITPPEGVTYTLWIANVSFLDVLGGILALICLATFRRSTRSAVKKQITGIMSLDIVILTLLLIGLYGLFLQEVLGATILEYSDSLIYSYRIVIFLLITRTYITITPPRELVNILITATVVLSVITNIAHYWLEYNGVLGGRLNMLGMGVNISAEFCLVAIILLFIAKPNYGVLRYYLSLLLLFNTILLTGSRRATVLALVLMMAFAFIRSNNSVKVKFGSKLMTGLLFILLALIFTSHGIVDSDLLPASIKRLRQTWQENTLAEDGRIEMYRNALNVLFSNPFGLGSSDWLIQEKLGVFGTGSHSHNVILQTYLKYGPIITLYLVPLIIFIISLHSRPYWLFVWLPILVNQMTGYGFWNVKYIFLIIVLYGLTTYKVKIRI